MECHVHSLQDSRIIMIAILISKSFPCNYNCYLMQENFLRLKWVKEVTRIQTICHVLNDQPGVKNLLTEVHKLLWINYTILVTAASAKGSFSALICIKTYIRNSMTQQRLNHCMLLHIHREQTELLDFTDIAKKFISRNERRNSLLEISKNWFDLSFYLECIYSFH